MGINDYHHRCCKCHQIVDDIRRTNGRYCVECRNKRSYRARNRKQELERLTSPAWAAKYDSGTSSIKDRNVIARADQVSAELEQFVKGKQFYFNQLSNTGGEGISGTLKQSSMKEVVNLLFKRGKYYFVRELCFMIVPQLVNASIILQCCRH
jgi:hypothetical protein